MNRLFLVFSLIGVPIFAQSGTSTQPAAPNPNPISAATKFMYNMSKSNVLKSAEEMPEENYSFKPVDTVRTFGQLVGHVADAQYEFCSVVAGDNKKSPDVEKTKTTKADLIAALNTAFAYCDQTYNSMTDAKGAQILKFFNFNVPALSILNINVSHNMEHYGNMVTYLRIKGLVPPSSQRPAPAPSSQE